MVEQWRYQTLVRRATFQLSYMFVKQFEVETVTTTQCSVFQHEMLVELGPFIFLLSRDSDLIRLDTVRKHDGSYTKRRTTLL